MHTYADVSQAEWVNSGSINFGDCLVALPCMESKP